MLKVQRVQQLSVFLENRAGQMALLCSCLADAGVNVSALSVADTIEHGLVRCVADNPDAACDALDGYGFNCLRTDVLEVELPDKIGALATFAECLGSAGVNIQYCYGSRYPQGGMGLLYVRVLDLEAAEEALERFSL
jgi:hypothetical protein